MCEADTQIVVRSRVECAGRRPRLRTRRDHGPPPLSSSRSRPTRTPPAATASTACSWRWARRRRCAAAPRAVRTVGVGGRCGTEPLAQPPVPSVRASATASPAPDAAPPRDAAVEAGAEAALERTLGAELLATLPVHSRATLRNGNGLVERWGMCRHLARHLAPDHVHAEPLLRAVPARGRGARPRARAARRGARRAGVEGVPPARARGAKGAAVAGSPAAAHRD